MSDKKTDIQRVESPLETPRTTEATSGIFQKISSISTKIRTALVVALATTGINCGNKPESEIPPPTKIEEKTLGTPSEDDENTPFHAPTNPINSPSAESPQSSTQETLRESLDPLSYTKEKYKNVPSLREQRIEDAFHATQEAINEIESTPSIKRVLERRGIELHPADYYLAIAIKESALNPTAVSGGGMLGLYQLSSKALEDLKRIYKVDLGREDIFYEGTSERRIAETSKNNAMAGILYWHLCRSIYVSRKFTPPISEADKEKATAFAYNMGHGAFRNLWNTIGADSFEEFSKRLAKIVADNTEGFTAEKRRRTNNTYNVEITTYLSFQRSPLNSATIRIGAREYTLVKIIEATTYAEIVIALIHTEPNTPYSEIISVQNK